MIANLSNIESIFNKCNAAYFGNELPLPKFGVLHTNKWCGYFSFTESGSWFGKTFCDPCIEISDYYDYTERDFVNVLCHEMIHYYLLYKGIDRKCHHGQAFKEMAKQLNNSYDLHITETIDASHLKRNPNAQSWFARFIKSLF